MKMIMELTTVISLCCVLGYIISIPLIKVLDWAEEENTRD